MRPFTWTTLWLRWEITKKTYESVCDRLGIWWADWLLALGGIRIRRHKRWYITSKIRPRLLCVKRYPFRPSKSYRFLNNKYHRWNR